MHLILKKCTSFTNLRDQQLAMAQDKYSFLISIFFIVVANTSTPTPHKLVSFIVPFLKNARAGRFLLTHRWVFGSFYGFIFLSYFLLFSLLFCCFIFSILSYSVVSSSPYMFHLHHHNSIWVNAFLSFGDCSLCVCVYVSMKWLKWTDGFVFVLEFLLWGCFILINGLSSVIRSIMEFDNSILVIGNEFSWKIFRGLRTMCLCLCCFLCFESFIGDAILLNIRI